MARSPTLPADDAPPIPAFAFAALALVPRHRRFAAPVARWIVIEIEAAARALV